MHDGTPLAGVAITVKTRPGDNLMIHHAMDIAGPGDVIVVDAGGDLTNSLMGEMMAAYATERGIAGFVLDGAIRDAGAIRAGEPADLRRRRNPSRSLQGWSRRDQRARSRSTAWWSIPAT